MTTPNQSSDAVPPLRNAGLHLDTWIAALGRMSGAHPDMARILRVVERLQDRPYRSHAVLYGEPGTGKEGLARLLHRLMSTSDEAGSPPAPLQRVQLLGRSEDEQLALLFGDGRGDGGAFERAHGGSLILDELMALSEGVQRRLYEAMQTARDQRTGVAVIALTDHDVPAAVAVGRFRHDLFYRLLRIVLHVPPLREREGDMAHSVLWICNRVLRDHGRERPAELYEPDQPNERAARLSKGAFRVWPGVIDILRNHRWPGNFRELEGVLERAILLYSDGEQLNAEDVRSALLDGWPTPVVAPAHL